MSKDLIDVDAFTSPVHVPEGMDPRDDAAGDVERLAQALADRTRYLQSRVDPLVSDAARKSADNTFTGLNTFTQSLIGQTPVADAAFLFSNSDPVTLGTQWRLVTTFKYAAGLYVRSYTGRNSNDNEGAFLIATNAEYDFGAATFHQNNATHESVAIIWHRGRIRISRIPAGAAPWASWPTGFAAQPSTSPAGTFMDALIEGEYRYTSPHYRGANVPLLSALGTSAVIDTATGFLRTSNLADPLVWALRLPVGVVLREALIIVNQTTGSNGTLSLWEITYDTGNVAAITRTLVDSFTSVGGSGVKMSSANWVSIAVKLEANYEVRWLPGHVNDDVRAVKLFVDDPGPRNF